MRRTKVGAATLNQTPLDWENNVANIKQAIKMAKEQGVKFLCLPELCITGYGCEDQFQSPETIRLAGMYLREIAAHTEGMLVSVGLPYLYKGSLYNVAAVLYNGGIAGYVAKKFLANDGLHYENRWFKSWGEGDKDGNFGDLRFSFDGITLGFEICEDAWTPHRVGANLVSDDVDIIFNPSASHFAFGKREKRYNLVKEGSRALNVVYVYANLLGNEAGRAIYDGDTMIASNGSLVGDGPRLTYDNVVLTTAVVDLDTNKLGRIKLGSSKPNVDNYLIISRVPYGLMVGLHTYEKPSSPVNEKIDSDYEEFSKVISLGLFDYMRKTRSHGFVVSLSGGADSAAAACLARLISYYGDLSSSESYKDKLKYCNGKIKLITIYQPTKNSSETTRVAAKTLADALGANHIEFDVDSLFNDYTSKVSKAIGRELSWETDDIALQNIQARVRAPGAWMLANINNSILLATSNRSEAAVGYATMDGDTCGGLSPLAGIDKDFLLKWLWWARKELNLISLDLVLKQKPTAELRPQDQEQQDEKDLMPYALLDEIEGLAIRDKKPPLEIFQTLTNDKYEDHQLGLWIEKFFKLWCRNQWKRERYAPSFHVDDKNLDPRSWCRFPILSGGFNVEIQIMWNYINKYNMHFGFNDG